MVSGIIPGSAGGGWSGVTGGGPWVPVRSRTRAAETAQIVSAAAVDLVPADEIETPQAVSVRIRADIDGQLPPGTELQIQRQPHDQRSHRVLEIGRAHV